MGNNQSLPDSHQYQVAVANPDTEGSSAIYRAATHPDELISGYKDRAIKNGWDIFKLSVQRYPRRRFLGRRLKNERGELGEYEWMSYAEAEAIALAFGSTLVREGLVREKEYPDELYEGARKMKVLGIYAKNCVEWFLAEQSCNAFGLTLCPLYDTLGNEAIEHILAETGLACILVAFDCLPMLLDVVTEQGSNGPAMKSSVKLRHIILIDHSNPEDGAQVRAQVKAAMDKGRSIGLNVLTWHETVAKGIETLPPSPASSESVNTLCYTSGTTGLPKGVILTHGNVVSVVCGATRGPICPHGLFDVSASDSVLSYLPLAHCYERCICNIVMIVGGAIGVYSGDMAKLLDDIKMLKPTVFVSVPRLFNRINDRIGLTLQDKRLPTQALFHQGLKTKINRRRAMSSTSHRVWDAVVFPKIRAMMGGRLRGMISGGAPLDPVILERMEAFFAVPLMQGYGLSESFGPCFLNHPFDPMAGPVGGVWPDIEFKLVSAPELQYFVTDRPSRGELCLRGPGITKGYFRNPTETNASFDELGWFHTGDIVQLLEQHKSIQIIDRKKNIFKLSQGEYVAPEKIEAVYSQCIIVGQIFVFGYSHKTCLVAIVVPDVDAAAKWANKNGADPELESLCKNPAFKSMLVADMEANATKNGLKGFEKVKAIHLTPTAFSVDNLQLTPTSKIVRNVCKQAYLKEIDDMYQALTAAGKA
eukprot:Protomagalhaensia_sp_Gyna_25__1642@NODE_184_length_4560_cov_95_754258_g143_i0_p1_GENE_NODE_184_length_4560_cov_95_754258_g143_i0NODE_184_length_4560_cov_95_754258_g143_i0_p1_ORF_typecomplete_len703_score138_50AMPbinding/PF00501_28/4_4e86AMPbinding_C/PF13193_6/0_0011Cas9_C/PF18525_1/0_37_NODE_184_length_4560_cov_95_754258_g143_i021904298